MALIALTAGPARGAMASSLLMAAATVATSFVAVAAPAAAPAREVMLWVDGNNLPGESEADWDIFMVNFTRYMRPAITSVAVCPYTVTDSGEFGYQDAKVPLCHGPDQAGEQQELHGIPRFRKLGLKQFPLLAGCPGTNIVMGMVTNRTKRTAFISKAVETMVQQGFQGYNVDFELFGSPSDVRPYQSFLADFSAALQTKNGSLTIDIDHCCKGHNDTGYACNGPGNAGYLGMSCADYEQFSGPDAVIYTLHTYVHDLKELLRTVNNSAPQIGRRYGVGVEAGLSIPNLRAALADISAIKDGTGRAAINHLGVWWNPPLHEGPSEEYMAAVGEWLRRAI